MLSVGPSCTVRAINARPELNGRCGEATAYDAAVVDADLLPLTLPPPSILPLMTYRL